MRGTCENAGPGGPLRFIVSSSVIAALIVFGSPSARAAPVTIAAGQTYTLSADLVVSGADTLDANGTVSSPCTVVGNGHAIVARSLTGHVNIQNCVLTGLGGTQTTTPAMDITVQGSGNVTINGSTFDASGTIQFHVNGSATASFTNNLLKDNGIA